MRTKPALWEFCVDGVMWGVGEVVLRIGRRSECQMGQICLFVCECPIECAKPSTI